MSDIPPQTPFSDRLKELIENPRAKEAFSTIASRDLVELNNVVWSELDSDTREALDHLSIIFRAVYKSPILVLSIDYKYGYIASLAMPFSTVLFMRVRIESADTFSVERAADIEANEITKLEKYLDAIEKLGKRDPGRFTDIFTDI
jgi:hypothetical protein